MGCNPYFIGAMLHFLLRLAAFGFAMLAVADCFLPGHQETLAIASHSQDLDGDIHHYFVHFANARKSRCSLSEEDSQRVQDGQQVIVNSRALTGGCTSIVANGQILGTPFMDRFTNLCAGLAALGMAFGPWRRKPLTKVTTT
jgi:hypothetical protein